MCRQLEQMKKDRIKNGIGAMGGGNGAAASNSSSATRSLVGGSSCRPDNQSTPPSAAGNGHDSYECVALHISPDLGERIMLSGDRSLLDEVFHETSQALMDARSGVAWNLHDTRHVIRFPLNGYCKLNSVQAITRLLNSGFRVAASNGGGVEGQQFSEYLFVRKAFPG